LKRCFDPKLEPANIKAFLSIHRQFCRFQKNAMALGLSKLHVCELDILDPMTTNHPLANNPLRLIGGSMLIRITG
jgi:hypothetical protein